MDIIAKYRAAPTNRDTGRVSMATEGVGLYVTSSLRFAKVFKHTYTHYGGPKLWVVHHRPFIKQLIVEPDADLHLLDNHAQEYWYRRMHIGCLSEWDKANYEAWVNAGEPATCQRDKQSVELTKILIQQGYDALHFAPARYTECEWRWDVILDLSLVVRIVPFKQGRYNRHAISEAMI